MRAAPVLRGGAAARAVWLVGGLFLFSCGIVCFLDSRLGLPPWDVLHQGLAKHTPLTFGEANIVVGIVVLALSYLLGARIGIGTVANATLIGVFVSLLTTVHVHPASLVARSGLLAVGLVLFGFGSAFYIGANLGAGPRDSLMLVGSARTGTRVGVVRAAIELTALALGFALGGTLGVGTLVFAALIGPSVEGSFWLISRTRAAT
jgi:uncharacterized membrane protein YczE